MQKDDLLVWIDLEMTGLDPRKDKILEIATLITNKDLEVIEEGPDLIIQRTQAELDTLIDRTNPFFKEETPLEREVVKSTTSPQEAEKKTLEFIQKHVTPNSSPLCGNSIYTDRFFLKFQMPSIDRHLHYRNIDVSSIKELARRWYPDVYEEAGIMKKGQHRARADIYESIEELKLYREKLFVSL